MSEAVEFLKGYPSIAMAGIRMVVGIPRRFDLRVDPDWDVRHRANGGGYKRPFGDRVWEGRPMPPLKTIHLMLRQKDVSGESHLTVAINLDTRRIDESGTSMVLFGREHMGSAGIGVALFSAPVVLPLLPVLMLTGAALQLAEKSQGMSRHGMALMMSLKGQLDVETEALLADALCNTWAFHQQLRRRVTFNMAKSILALHRLEESVIVSKSLYHEDIRSFHWFDEAGEVVATGMFGNNNHFISVYSSMFSGTEADTLAGIYRVRKHEAISDKD